MCEWEDTASKELDHKRKVEQEAIQLRQAHQQLQIQFQRYKTNIELFQKRIMSFNQGLDQARHKPPFHQLSYLGQHKVIFKLNLVHTLVEITGCLVCDHTGPPWMVFSLYIA
ncbi:Catechol 1,2-dioxygenase [Fusarium oxysporum f. sp. albedinis]|nr:Catechol 1,2-dioxygenase [Fusarium oxysporum f. sp. albedinis]